MGLLANPVLIKEVKTKLRGRQSPRSLAVVAGLMALFILWCYYHAIGWLFRFASPRTGEEGWQIGLVMQAILIWALCPALTANAISQEKEQQTWEMLTFTLLTPAEILLGKLLARLIPLAATVAAFAPFMAVCFSMSGLSYVYPLAAGLSLIIWMVFLATVGLFMSWAFHRTASAVAASYLVVFGLVIGTALVELTLSMGGGDGDSFVLWLNPVRICAALLDIDRNPNAAGVILFSSFAFAGIAAFLLWRMVSRFRAFATK